MTSTTPRRWLLRERTADAHKQLDGLVGSWATLDEYRTYLSATSRFRAGIEQALSRHRVPESLGRWHWPEITGTVASDLIDLDTAVPPAAAFAGSLAGSRLLGALYVLEGSSLGSQLLCRRAISLGLSELRGARHLHLLSQRVDQWRLFLVALEATDADEEELVEGALATFALAAAAFGSADDAMP